ncbi:SPS1 Serine threonine protein kinase [Pyrenophora tritici-repentis]|nr:Serine/threonine-protein kinase minibrain [Pyrenophora tritici-repentis]KAI0610359.1 Serine/threonine-protein kinase minibrain [Pyrenophora tritici-repentis]KAI1540902.1 SPS1 Serine threonine protein kinase [Pyrenophora tritici-repentis]KAI1547435.1 SPS1 Serine threonine protein kinase [Pyrenophora tritici-repentis]KAI1552405.1 SPS1 Serine threonine protein kinase [Pyrenophora tritici-repentis]
MEPQWTAYSDTPGARYSHSMASPQHAPRDASVASHMKPDAYATPSRQNSMALQSPAGPGTRGPEYNDGDGDVPMEDAYKPRLNVTRPSQTQRQSQQYLQQAEESAAARRYSPMNLSPTSPYSGSTQQAGQSYTSFTPQTQAQSQASRQSPTRNNPYMSPPNSYYSPPSSRPNAPQLPPIQSNMSPESYYPQSATAQLNAVYNREAPSPRASSSSNAQQLSPLPIGRGPVPKFEKCVNTADLRPKINTQPPFRRANPEGGFISPLQALTAHLPMTYKLCNGGFNYQSSRNPRRVLTKPSKGVKNDGYDNEDSDYILYVNDILGSEESGHKNRYLILDVLGQGTFGQVVKCQNLKTQEVVAVKVIKNRTAYFNQSMMEVSVLDLLNKQMDKNDDHHLLRLKDTFIHRQHLCLVFELLSVNLYELIKQNQFRGLSTTLVRVFAQQLINGLALLGKAKLIHCDLKPENILLKKYVDWLTFARTRLTFDSLESPIIKIIDFGSACDERQTVYTYIQSRFYRSPEVLLGLPYSAAIDMWSLGCIVVELFLGLPLFPGSSEYNQVSRITEMLGLPPHWMLEMGKQSGEFYEKSQDEYGRKQYRLKSMEQYSREHGTKEQPSKKYFSATTLPDIIKNYPMPRKNMKPNEIEREMANRAAFIDFAQGLLNLNPLERWTPAQAKLHPFITQAKFTGPFVPPMTLKSGSSRSPAPAAQSPQAQQNPYNMYNPNHQGAPPPYPAQAAQYAQPMNMMQPQQPRQYNQPQNLYAQATTRAGRQRATTMDQQQSGQSGIPPALQRVMSHLDPNAPVRLQPSPAYYPPPPDGAPESASSARRRGSRAGNSNRNHNFVRNLEDRTLEEGFMGQNHWQ